MSNPTPRKATPDDALALAELMDQAGEGIPSWLWAQDAQGGETALDVGIARARRSEGSFSYTNASVLEDAGQVAGMLLGYLQPADIDVEKELEGVPDFLVPLVELECLAPGTFYINALAVYPHHRSKGYGSLLMAEAERRALELATGTLSIMVFEGNEGAVRLYKRLGFEFAAERQVVKHVSTVHTGRELLLTRTIS
ncbi:MAG: N-acetyltransferase [Rhodospirillaceae bacterium]|nr:N-acetyltransferase [Rhodospirillaceae bacterium]MBL6931276.1 N-acetyltransferase [Rhodospirillales bacterium]